MFWLGLLLVTGGAYTAINKGLDSPIGIGLLAIIPLAYILAFPIMGIMWVNEQTGIDAAIVRSFQFLSGVDRPSEVVVECVPSAEYPGLGYSILSLLVYLTGLLLMAADAILMLVAIIGLPFGILLTSSGGLWTLITRNPAQDNLVLTKGFQMLLAGVASVITIGLSFRLIHYVTGLLVC